MFRNTVLDTWPPSSAGRLGCRQTECRAQQSRPDCDHVARKRKKPLSVNSRAFDMAQRTGLEPATPGVTGRYSNQLNYRCALPRVVGGDGIEPPTLCL